MDCALLHGRETAGRTALHRGILSGSTRNAIRLHWWHHSCSGRLPHSRLSAQIDSPYIVRAVLLGFLLTGCWMWPYSGAPEQNSAGLLKKKKCITITVHFLFYALSGRITHSHSPFKAEMPGNKATFLYYIPSREKELGSWESPLFAYYSQRYFYWNKSSLA